MAGEQEPDKITSSKPAEIDDADRRAEAAADVYRGPIAYRDAYRAELARLGITEEDEAHLNEQNRLRAEATHRRTGARAVRPYRPSRQPDGYTPPLTGSEPLSNEQKELMHSSIEQMREQGYQSLRRRLIKEGASPEEADRRVAIKRRVDKERRERRA